jgi:hypothetical protein
MARLFKPKQEEGRSNFIPEGGLDQKAGAYDQDRERLAEPDKEDQLVKIFSADDLNMTITCKIRDTDYSSYISNYAISYGTSLELSADLIFDWSGWRGRLETTLMIGPENLVSDYSALTQKSREAYQQDLVEKIFKQRWMLPRRRLLELMFDPLEQRLVEVYNAVKQVLDEEGMLGGKNDN